MWYGCHPDAKKKFNDFLKKIYFSQFQGEASIDFCVK
jgi:hypothetical protein